MSDDPTTDTEPTTDADDGEDTEGQVYRRPRPELRDDDGPEGSTVR